jgi:hypothetical protein
VFFILEISMATTPEGRVKDLIKKWLVKNSIPYWMPTPSPLGKSVGMSDFLAITPKHGTWLVIEAKRPGGKHKVTAHQQKFIDTINTNGGLGFVVDSQDDLGEIEMVLKDRGLI